MMSRIIDQITKEISEAINIIWNQNTLAENLKKMKENPDMGGIKTRLDNAQCMLLELLTYLEQFENRLALGFYWLEDVEGIP